VCPPQDGRGGGGGGGGRGHLTAREWGAAVAAAGEGRSGEQSWQLSFLLVFCEFFACVMEWSRDLLGAWTRTEWNKIGSG
jgi:hypothetical protein